MEYNLILPIEFNGVYSLTKTITLSDIDKVLEFIDYLKRNPENPIKKINNFLKYNHSCLWLTLKIIPLPFIIKMYDEYNFLANYWTKELFQNLTKSNWKNLAIHHANKQIATDYLVSINGYFNVHYNFVIFEKLYNYIKKEYPVINWDKFYIGTNMLLYMSYKL